MAQGNYSRRKRKSDAGIVALASAGIILVVIAGAVLGGGAYVAGRDTIFPNVTVAGVDVGGMTYDAARSTLLSSAVGVPAGIEATAVLTDTQSVSVTSDEAGLTLPVTEAVDEAYSIGRDKGFFKNLGSFISCLTTRREVYSQQVFNEDGVRAKIAQAASLVNHDAEKTEYEVTPTEIFVTMGSGGYTVDEEGVFEFIRETLLSGTSRSTDEFSEAKTAGGSADAPDIDAIYREVHTEPKSAYYDSETGKASAAVPGVSFDVDGAKSLVAGASAGETVRIPLVFTDPGKGDGGFEEGGSTGTGGGEGEITDLLFRDKLAEKDTTLASSAANRITNITLAAEAVNGTVLNPGDEFSYNGIVGQRTEAKGYKPAGAYANGGHATEVGGGICQLSSTIYFCTLKADLEITDRHNHGYTVAYLPASTDATVNWPNLDFKFKNNKNYPIKVLAWVENKRLYVELWGTKEDDYTVMLESNTLSTISPKEVEKLDESLAPGERKVQSNGQTGLVSECYKLIYDGDGKLVSRTLVSKDTYRAMDKVVLVGPEPSKPAGGDGGTTTPDEGDGGTTTPDEGNGGTTTPDEGDGGATTPDEGNGGTTTPDEGDGGTTTPDEGDGGTTTPDEGDGGTTTPDEGGGDTTPPDEGGGDTTPPDEGGGDDTADPGEGDEGDSVDPVG